MTSDLVGAWVAVGFTLFMLSFLYEDNPFYKLGEHLYLGVSIGYNLAQLIWQTMIPKWWEPLVGSPHDWELLIPTLIGVLYLARLVPKAAWLSRWSMAATMGFGAGLGIPLTVASQIFTQAQGTVKPLVKAANGAVATTPAALWQDCGALLILVGVVSVLVYFFFSVEHKGPVKAVSKIGILFLMVYFGASYGNTVPGRFALLYGRCADLKTYASSSFSYASYVLAALLIAALAVMRLTRSKGAPPSA